MFCYWGGRGSSFDQYKTALYRTMEGTFQPISISDAFIVTISKLDIRREWNEDFLFGILPTDEV